MDDEEDDETVSIFCDNIRTGKRDVHVEPQSKKTRCGYIQETGDAAKRVKAAQELTEISFIEALQFMEMANEQDADTVSIFENEIRKRKNSDEENQRKQACLTESEHTVTSNSAIERAYDTEEPFPKKYKLADDGGKITTV